MEYEMRQVLPDHAVFHETYFGVDIYSAREKDGFYIWTWPIYPPEWGPVCFNEEPFEDVSSGLSSVKLNLMEDHTNPRAFNVYCALLSIGISRNNAETMARIYRGHEATPEDYLKVPEIWREAVNKSGEIYQEHYVIAYRKSLKEWGFAYADTNRPPFYWRDGSASYPNKSKALMAARRAILEGYVNQALVKTVYSWCAAKKIVLCEWRSLCDSIDASKIWG